MSIHDLYQKMWEVIPESNVGDYRVENFTISKEEAELYSTMATYNRDYLGRMLRAGKFCRLMCKSEVLMSDTDAERSTNYEVIRAAHGEVLIAGLGLGLIVIPICRKKEVQKITVVEVSEEVISLVEPHLRKFLGGDADKLEIVHSDIHEFKTSKKYNVIYFDIWNNISGDEYPETKTLHKLFSKYLIRDGTQFMDSWMRWYMKDKHFEGR